MKNSQYAISAGLIGLALSMSPASMVAAEADSLGTWFSEGSVKLLMNPRYEYAKVGNLEESNAVTLKTLLSFSTADWSGFSGTVEFTDTHALDYDDYNAAGLNGQPGKSVVADPETTELNQFFLKYGFDGGSVTAGRQRYILDNARFVGNVGWRQNEQTFDAISADFSPIDGLTFKGSYIAHVNRIFADDRDWDSESVTLNGNWKVAESVSVTAYYYHLDFDGAIVTTDTFGGFVDGAVKVSDGFKVTYHLEYATQDVDNSTISTDYFHGIVGSNLGPVSVKLGYEILGSDNGAGQFLTPLATAHAFNGFADAFLNNGGAGGLHDMYASVSTKAGPVTLTAVGHLFDGDEGGAAEGEEIDLVAVYPITKNLKALAKAAFFDGETLADIDRFIFQVTASF